MSARRKLWTLWLVIGAVLALVAIPVWHPLWVAWRCYELHENAPREQARVMAKLEERAVFGLLIEAGPHAGQACTADTSRAIFEATQEGDALEVVHVDWKPGSCELVSTLEASARVLWLVVGGIGVLAFLLLGFGAFLHRSLTRPGVPARRMPVQAHEVRCPACGKRMDEGYLPILAGVHWRRPGEPLGLPHALSGLPGTVGWRGRPVLHAFRCVPCEIVSFQYGTPAAR